MKRQQITWVAAAFVTSAVLAVFAPTVLFVVAGVVGAGFALFWIGRCRHGGRLGLLPPTLTEDGTRLPARWFCDACGRSWPAGLESERATIVRFSGYDQTKLPAAARRAAALEKQRHSLAVKRAGLTRPENLETPAPANVTSINDRRVAG